MKLPSICSSTNSKVSNMITFINDGSGSVYSDWCHIYPFLDSVLLDDIVGALALPQEIIKNVASERTELEKVIKLMEQQSKTGLQGIIFNALEFLEPLLTDSNASHGCFEQLIKVILERMCERKPCFCDEELLFFTLDTYALTLPGIDGPKMCEGSASLAVNEHYYYFGSKETRNDPIILKKAKTRIYEISTGLFRARSYFSSFCEDVLIHVALWSLLNSESLNQKITVAQVVKSFYDRQFKWINVNDIANDSRPQEYMANAAIANASHQNVYGETDGVTFFKEFAIQVQIVPEPYGRQLRNMIPDCPERLNTFLKSLKIPYYIPQKPVDPSDPEMATIEALRGLMKIGQSRRLDNQDGFDVAFDLNESGLVQGRIECKNLQNTVAKGFAKKYIIRAMEKRIPLTFFLIRKAAPSLRSKELFGCFKDTATEPRPSTTDIKELSEANPLAQCPIEFINNPQETDTSFDASGEFSLSDLIAAETRQDPSFGEFRINVYSLVREANENYENLVFKTLYEDPAAQGHFIIIESNCNLSPDVDKIISRNLTKKNRSRAKKEAKTPHKRVTTKKMKNQ